MLLQKNLTKTIPLLLSLIFIMSAPNMVNAQDKDMDKEEPEIYITEMGQKYEIIGWKADIV